MLTADEAVIEPAVDGRGGSSKDRGRLFDSQQLALGEGSGRLEARDVPLPPQTADMVGGKAVTVSGMKGDWDAWNARSLAEEPIIRLILDGTVVRVRLDRKATTIVLLVVLGVREDG